MRIYQLAPAYTDDAEAYQVPPDTQPGDILLIAVDDVILYRHATGDDGTIVTPWRQVTAEPDTVSLVVDHLTTPTGWVKAPTVDGGQPLADQGFR